VNVITDNVADAINPAPGAQGPTDQSDVTAISFSADNPVTTITTTITIANLSSTPSPGNGVMLYRVVWMAPDGKTYAAEAQVSAGDNVVYGWESTTHLATILLLVVAAHPTAPPVLSIRE